MTRHNALRVANCASLVARRLGGAIAIMLMTLPRVLLFAGETWDGGGSNDNWTTGANWNPIGPFLLQVPPPNNGTANILMPAVTGLVQTPIVDVPYSINSLTFNSDGGNGRFVVLAAAQLTIGSGGITNNDEDLQSVIGPVMLAANQTWNAAAGPLQVDTVTLNGFNLALTNAHEIDVISLIVDSGTVDMSMTGTRLNVTNLTMRGGTISDPPGSTVSPLYLYGSTVRSEAAAATGRIEAFLDLSQAGSGFTVFDVADGTPAIDLDVTQVFNDGIRKTGAGTLRIGGASRPLGYHITAGTLLQGQPPSGYDLFDITFEGGIFQTEVPLGTFADVEIIGTATIDGPNDLSLYGQVSGVGGLVKRGSGTLTYGSPNFNTLPNTYTGATVVEAGTLVLAKQSNGAIVSDLVIGDGVGGIPADVVRLGASNQITAKPGRTVTVSNSGYFDINGKSEEIDSLVVNGGGVGGASGTLTVHSLTVQAGNVSMGSGKVIINGNFTSIAAAESATISGKLELGGQTRAFAVADGSASIDLDIPAQISNGGISKTSPGVLRLRGNNTFAGGVTVSAGTLLVDSAVGSATGTGLVNLVGGMLTGNGTIAGSLENRAIVSPGMSPGILNVAGNYAQFLGGQLLIEVGSAENYDHLFVTGDAILGDILTVTLLDGFVPNIGDSFTILTAASVEGVFTSEILPSLPNRAFDVIYTAQSVVLTVLLPGDFDADGDVDAADYVVWRNNDGTQAGYNLWRTHFGVVAGSGFSAVANATVPEPASTTLLLFAMFAMYARFRVSGT